MTDTFTTDDDKKLAEWLKLDLEFTCPKCGSTYFGTENAHLPHDQWERWCHDQFHSGCKWHGKDADCFRLPILTAPTPDSDYRVLEAVRRMGLVDAVADKAFPYGISHEVLDTYQPGDYAIAAYAVMKEQGNE